MCRIFLSLSLCLVVGGFVMSEEPKTKEQTLKISFSTPNPTWGAKIVQARQVGKEIWVKVVASSPGGIAPQVIGTAEDEVKADLPELPIKYIVFGKTWGWKNEEKAIIFLNDLDQEKAELLEKNYNAGTKLFERKTKE